MSFKTQLIQHKAKHILWCIVSSSWMNWAGLEGFVTTLFLFLCLLQSFHCNEKKKVQLYLQITWILPVVLNDQKPLSHHTFSIWVLFSFHCFSQVHAALLKCFLWLLLPLNFWSFIHPAFIRSICPALGKWKRGLWRLAWQSGTST